MDNSELLGRLIDLTEQLGIAIRRAPLEEGTSLSGHVGGSVVHLKGKEIIFLDTTATLEDQIAVVCKSLSGHKELAERFIPPQVRNAIETSD